MKRHMQSLRDEAERLFLGRSTVIGVALTQENGSRIVAVLMEKSEPAIEGEIREWARRQRAVVTFIVTGSNAEIAA